MLTIYNKSDLIENDFFASHHPYILMSAYQKTDRDKLLLTLENLLKEEWDYYAISLAPDQGKVINQFGIHTIVTKKQYNEHTNQYDVEGFIPEMHPLQRILKEHNS